MEKQLIIQVVVFVLIAAGAAAYYTWMYPKLDNRAIKQFTAIFFIFIAPFVLSILALSLISLYNSFKYLYSIMI